MSAKGKGNGSPPDEVVPVRITVVDRRHHAHPEEGAGQGGSEGPRHPALVEELKARAEAAERLAREAMTKAQTEIDAVRERLQRDVDRRVMEGKSRLLVPLLEVLDNLDRAIRVAESESKVVAEGIGLIRQQVLALLSSEGIEQIETLGLEYDPNVAEAVVVEKVEPGRDNLVTEELQRGYRYGSIILRHARVKVGRA